MEEIFKKRIDFKGDIKELSIRICKDYNLGEFKANKIITTGYEDFNYILETARGSFFVKVFAIFRGEEDCKRYVEIMEETINRGVSTPRLLKNEAGEYLDKVNIDNSKLRLVLLEFIKGKTFYELNKKAEREDIIFLAKQAAIINSINIQPKPVYDAWAVINFLEEYNKKAKYLSEEDLLLIKPLVGKFSELNIERLPRCFVHGDIISTNVIKEKNKLWIIDFSVSNYYPRIQELAVLACNIWFDEKSKKNSEENIKIALKEYQTKIKLTQNELKALPKYIELAHGMHLLSANYEKVVNNNQTPENEYWISQGRMGLKQFLE